MENNRRDFLKVLAGGAVAGGLAVTGKQADAKPDEVELDEGVVKPDETKPDEGVVLFVCGNCDKWKQAKHGKVYVLGFKKPTYEEYLRDKEHYSDIAQPNYNMNTTYANYCVQKKADYLNNLEKSRITAKDFPLKGARGVAYPGDCPLLPNQQAYSDDPACENFCIRQEGELIRWKPKEEQPDV